MEQVAESIPVEPGLFPAELASVQAAQRIANWIVQKTRDDVRVCRTDEFDLVEKVRSMC